jgi:hypothetical protein
MRLTMLKTVEGFYRDGKIELAEMPGASPEPSPVLVTFLDPNQGNVVQLREYLEQLEAIQGIQQGLADVEAGNTRPLSEFEAEMRQKYGISG